MSLKVLSTLQEYLDVNSGISFIEVDFNEMVNMTVDELETWLKGSKSKKAGWPKEDNSGEAIGHESYSPDVLTGPLFFFAAPLVSASPIIIDL